MVDQASAVCAGNSAELPSPWSSQAKRDFDAVVDFFLGVGKIQAESYIALEGTDIIEEGIWKDKSSRVSDLEVIQKRASGFFESIFLIQQAYSTILQ